VTNWDYRVVKEFDYNSDEMSLSIREAYYNDNGELCGYTQLGVSPHVESIEELRDILNRMLLSLDKPVLVDGEVVFAEFTDKDEDNE
jgi:hypothetical protein